MDAINFSYNWNNKLTNKAFTTIRLHNPNKYKTGERYAIRCNGQHKGIAILQEIRTLRLNQLNNFITYIDTGYSVPETIEILKTMYKNSRISWDTQLFDFCMLVYIRENEPDLQTMLDFE